MRSWFGPLTATLSCLMIISGNGCAVAGKYGSYDIRDSGTEAGMENKDYWALEVQTKSFWNDKVDMNFGFAIKDGPDHGNLATPTGSISAVDIDMSDVYATMRYYPLNASDTDLFFEPYIGGGIGYFRLKSESRTRGEHLGGSNFGTWRYDYYEIDESTDTMAEGFFTHVVLGAYVPIGDSKWSLVIEDRIDMEKEENGFDFAGNIIMIGVRYGF